jgi:hypothetical protein
MDFPHSGTWKTSQPAKSTGEMGHYQCPPGSQMFILSTNIQIKCNGSDGPQVLHEAFNNK